MRILPEVGAAGFTDRERVAIFQAVIAYNGLTGAGAAGRLGVSYAHTQLVLSGERFASPALKDRLAAFLKQPAEVLFPEEEERRARRRTTRQWVERAPAAQPPNMVLLRARLATLKISGPAAARKLQSIYNHMVCVLSRQREGSDAFKGRIAAFIGKSVEELFPSARSTAPVPPMSGFSPNQVHSVSNPGRTPQPGISS